MNTEYRGRNYKGRSSKGRNPKSRNYKSRNDKKKRRKKLIITLAILVVLVGAASAAVIVLNSRTEVNSDLAYAKEREEDQASTPETLTGETTDTEIYNTEKATLLGEESTETTTESLVGSDPAMTEASDNSTEAYSTEAAGEAENAEALEKDKVAEKKEAPDKGELHGEEGDPSQNEFPIVPESDVVEDSYFDDAVFIGDSRVDGFRIQSGLGNPEYLTAKGMNVKAIFTETYIKKDGNKMTVLDALKKMEFNKIYIKLGINELGWKYPKIFAEDYAKLIGEIRKINPDADIYVQSIIVVSKSKSDKDATYNNKNIATFNELLLQMAKDEEVSYLDLNEALAGEDGNLPEDASFDGVHLNPDYCKIWLKYLKNHVKE